MGSPYFTTGPVAPATDNVGTIANMLPGTALLPVGDVAQRYVDVATSNWANNTINAINTKAQGDISSLYTAGQSQVADMLNAKAQDLGVPERNFQLAQLADTGKVHYYTSINEAYKAAFGNG
ncbi:hypothetical protein [Kitasatospora cathayae]|uniref:Uncharacterized protein n=1 Tax=Kitasatospora cathayae TaxID=3004092 RepID=A0ABY7QA94_9ACTN|nr:hypothetical protein [Kitasatospora sp. HUAS 3-15]WBP89668.1 hypothetical protein O1G21_30015 [Kitasatospora sp. HUAS 3-15]